MFDPKELLDMPAAPSALPSIDTLDLEGLLKLQAEIEAKLPPTKLADLDLERALMLQYHRTQALLAKTLDAGADVPANQKAQVANSCAAVLQQIVKMQAELYNAERLKAIESVLIKVLKTLPKEAQELFVETYARMYGEATLGGLASA